MSYFVSEIGKISAKTTEGRYARCKARRGVPYTVIGVCRCQDAGKVLLHALFYLFKTDLSMSDNKKNIMNKLLLLLLIPLASCVKEWECTSIIHKNVNDSCEYISDSETEHTSYYTGKKSTLDDHISELDSDTTCFDEDMIAPNCDYCVYTTTTCTKK